MPCTVGISFGQKGQVRYEKPSWGRDRTGPKINSFPRVQQLHLQPEPKTLASRSLFPLPPPHPTLSTLPARSPCPDPSWRRLSSGEKKGPSPPSSGPISIRPRQAFAPTHWSAAVRPNSRPTNAPFPRAPKSNAGAQRPSSVREATVHL